LPLEELELTKFEGDYLLYTGPPLPFVKIVLLTTLEVVL